MVIEVTQNSAGLLAYQVGYLSHDGFHVFKSFYIKPETYEGEAFNNASDFCSFLNGGVKPEWM